MQGGEARTFSGGTEVRKVSGRPSPYGRIFGSRYRAGLGNGTVREEKRLLLVA